MNLDVYSKLNTTLLLLTIQRIGARESVGCFRAYIINAIVVWNTRYMSLALDSIRNKDININHTDIHNYIANNVRHYLNLL